MCISSLPNTPDGNLSLLGNPWARVRRAPDHYFWSTAGKDSPTNRVGRHNLPNRAG
jgi:hypothetical protein